VCEGERQGCRVREKERESAESSKAATDTSWCVLWQELVSAERSKGDLHPDSRYKRCGVVLEVPARVGEGLLYLVAETADEAAALLQHLK
jgi:hypothetical protein